ncbi:MAG: isochorismatase family protein [Burkholderiales bacterium]|nr:isochorismatase family protein [Burkholderiales bacterium]
MELSDKTARQLYEEMKGNPRRRRYGFGSKAMVVNVDLQKAFTLEAEFNSAYSADPKQMDYVNAIAALARAKNLPIVWTYIAYKQPIECGIWGTRSDNPDSLQNIKFGSRRAELDDRLSVDRERDIVIDKRGASAFFQTNLGSLLVWHRVDTLIVTGGSTSGCVRATVVDSLQYGYRTVVPEECVDDRHESPHFASLYDMAMKYADVLPVAEVIAYLKSYAPPNNQERNHA